MAHPLHRFAKKWLIVGGMMCMVLAGVRPVQAQVRDSDLTAGQYAYGAAVFGGIGAGVGMGIDVMLIRNQPRRPEKPARLLIAPAVWKNTKAVAVKWRW